MRLARRAGPDDGPRLRRHHQRLQRGGLQPRGCYSAAKAWVNRFGDWAAQEYGKQGVHR